MFSAEGKYRKTYRHQFNQLRSDPTETEIPLSTLANRIERKNIPLSAAQINALRQSEEGVVDIDGFQKIITSKQAQSSFMKRIMYDVADPVITTTQKIEIHSYIDSYSCLPPPIFMLLITIIQIGIFLYYYETDGRGSIWTDCSGCFTNHDHRRPGPFIFAPTLRDQAWRFTSYMFLHAGLNHLLGNVIVQLIVGIPLEVAHKIWRIGPVYLLAVTAGALLQYAIDPSSLLVGASAGVYALIFAHVANVILNWNEMPFRWVRVTVLAIFITFDFGGALYRRYMLDQCDSVSHLAHVAGAVTGLLFGYCTLYNVVEHKIEVIARYACLGLYTIFIVFTIILVIVREPNSSPLWGGEVCK